MSSGISLKRKSFDFQRKLLSHFNAEKFIIYGSNRVARDFEYIFSDIIDIEGQISDGESPSEKRGYPIIVCEFDKKEKIEILEKKGYKRGADYFIESDFFGFLDSFGISENRELYVWGTGKNAETLA